MRTTPRLPAGLGSDGKRLWRTVLADAVEGSWEYDNRELTLLYRCARMADRIAVMDRELDGADLLVPGYLGKGTVSNPLLAELRQTESLLAQTLTRLKPPSDESEPSASIPRSVRARVAANARWGKR